MDFQGIIIAESLTDCSVLDDVQILSTKVEPVQEKHRTPWVKQWTMHTVTIAPEQAAALAEQISHALDAKHDWYADYKNETEHYVIYRDKVFHMSDRSDAAQYDAATRYGIALGIPHYQVDFSPHVQQWERK